MSAEILELHHHAPRTAGRPVLLIHGFSHSGLVWEPLMDAMPESLRPMTVDLRGHGSSPWSPCSRYSVDDYAGDLVGVLDRVGIERCVVVGHSLGGNAATLFAARHQERVDALVLVDTGPAMALGALTRIASDVGNATADFASVDTYARVLAGIHPLASPDELARLAEGWLVQRLDGRFEPRMDPGTLCTNLGQEEWRSLEGRLWQALANIACPTLLVRGTLSSVLSVEVAREMTDSILQAGELVSLDRAGHAVMIDDLPGLASALLGFIDRLDGRVARPADFGPPGSRSVSSRNAIP